MDIDIFVLLDVTSLVYTVSVICAVEEGVGCLRQCKNNYLDNNYLEER